MYLLNVKRISLLFLLVYLFVFQAILFPFDGKMYNKNSTFWRIKWSFSEVIHLFTSNGTLNRFLSLDPSRCFLGLRHRDTRSTIFRGFLSTSKSRNSGGNRKKQRTKPSVKRNSSGSKRNKRYRKLPRWNSEYNLLVWPTTRSISVFTVTLLRSCVYYDWLSVFYSNRFYIHGKLLLDSCYNFLLH